MATYISTQPVSMAWNAVGTAQRALITAIRKKPQPNTVLLWQQFALKCQELSNAMWAEERARQPVQTPVEPVPTPSSSVPFDPRITKWIDASGNENFDFPMCPFKRDDTYSKQKRSKKWGNSKESK